MNWNPDDQMRREMFPRRHEGKEPKRGSGIKDALATVAYWVVGIIVVLIGVLIYSAWLPG